MSLRIRVPQCRHMSRPGRFRVAGGPEAAQGKTQGGAGERVAGRIAGLGTLRVRRSKSGPGGMAGVLLRNLQTRSAKREAREQVPAHLVQCGERGQYATSVTRMQCIGRRRELQALPHS